MKEINIFTFFCICLVYEMASEVPKKMIKIHFEGSFQCLRRLGLVISSDLFPFTSVIVYSDVFYRFV